MTFGGAQDLVEVGGLCRGVHGRHLKTTSAAYARALLQSRLIKAINANGHSL
jgi:hypothetical protein